MKKILLYNSGGGLGDSIQLFTLILSLKNHFKSAEFFYLGAHQNHFQGKLKEFNIDIKTLDLGLRYFGFRWWHLLFVKKKYLNIIDKKIDLVIDLQSKIRNTLILRRIPHEQFYSPTYNFKFCTKKKDYTSDDHLKNLSNFLNTNIKIIKFNVNNLNKRLLTEAKRLLPDKNYVGFSITQGNIYRKKSWSVDNFITLANKISSKNKRAVFFIEKNEKKLVEEIKKKLPDALFPELYTNFSCPALVTALSSRLELGISIDNGIMHMMGLANIPMIVLFGPTNSEKFTSKIESCKILDSKKIYDSNDINLITVHDVFKQLDF